MNEKYYLNSDIEEICKNIKSYSKIISGKVFLISGANGFLGKYFIKTIISMNSQLNKKAKIIAIDIKYDNCEIFKNKNVKKIKADINKINNLTNDTQMAPAANSTQPNSQNNAVNQPAF